MLVNSKENQKGYKIIIGAMLLLIALVLLKLFIQNKTNFFSAAVEDKLGLKEIELPVSLSSKLYTEDLLTMEKNKLYSKDNFSLYLNNELGAPTLMAVYKNDISTLEKDGRFLVFLYLDDPTEWRAVNQRYDHILLEENQLIPIKTEIDDEIYYIFKFRLEHPYFKFDNLKKLEFVRHTRKSGRFTELFFEKDSLPPMNIISNTLKSLQLTLKSKALAKITSKRDAALKSGILVTNDDDYVKAKISTDGQKSVNTTIRLKGDWTDHLEHSSKWSYRIIPEGDKTMFGMRKFSIQHPKSRNFVWEWLFNKVVKDNDLTGLRYDFLNVTMKISDKGITIPMGIMALEESFDKILIENNKRREGLILGFDEAMIWDDRKQVKDLKLDYPDDTNRPKHGDLPIKIYNENKTLSDPNLSKQFEIAKNLLIGLRDKKLKLSEAFDVDKLAFYVALSNLFGGEHGLLIENIRIYYNPVTHKLEPISFDSNSGFKVRSLRDYPIGIQDELFQAKLIENYEKVSSQAFITDFLQKYLEELNTLSLTLSGEFNGAAIDFDILQHNANFIKNKIKPSTSLSASFISFEKDMMQIEVRNFSDLPMVINGLVLKNKKVLNQVDKSIILQAKDTVTVHFRMKEEFNNAFVSKKNKEGGFRYPKDLPSILLKYHVLGADHTQHGEIKAFHSNFEKDVISNLAHTDTTNDVDFIQTDEETSTLLFKSGVFQLDKTLIIPAKYVIKVEPGFQLNLVNNASIISYAPLICKGTQDNPITFFSTDDTGGGIFVSGASEKSIIMHTSFINLSIPSLDGWSLSGAVNFNESVVEISNCIFEKNRSEDALNIIRSTFTVDSTAFNDTFSDAFDGDFVEGSITNSEFVNSGNDGIDISGSILHLSNITIRNPSDKGLSAGEGSTMTGNNISITGGEIGVVSKDLSTITLTDVIIENTRLGIACFQKKSEFGPGVVNLKKLQFLRTEVPYLIAETSDLIIDDVKIKDKSKDVIDKMYGNEYGKSSR